MRLSVRGTKLPAVYRPHVQKPTTETTAWWADTNPFCANSLLPHRLNGGDHYRLFGGIKNNQDDIERDLPP